MKQLFLVLSLFVILAPIFGQQTTPVTPQPTALAPRPARLSLDQMRLTQQALQQASQTLRNQNAADPVPSVSEVVLPAPRVAEPGARLNAVSETVPASFQPVLRQPLSPTAMDGVALSARSMSERNSPTLDKDGRALYTFGVGLPTVVCAPLRVCTVELQAGERVVGEPQLGDSMRWIVSPLTSGADADTTTVIVLKPKTAGLDTTMVIATDRRTYYVRLVSEPEQFMARTAFQYTDDEHYLWKTFLVKQEKERAAHQAQTQIAALGKEAVDCLHFDYKISKAKDPTVRPVRVMDDGDKTYITMPDSTTHHDLPTLVVVKDGQSEMVNFRVKDNTYIVDRLFDHAQLLIGTGKHQERVSIDRSEKGI